MLTYACVCVCVYTYIAWRDGAASCGPSVLYSFAKSEARMAAAKASASQMSKVLDLLALLEYKSSNTDTRADEEDAGRRSYSKTLEPLLLAIYC